MTEYVKKQDVLDIFHSYHIFSSRSIGKTMMHDVVNDIMNRIENLPSEPVISNIPDEPIGGFHEQ